MLPRLLREPLLHFLLLGALLFVAFDLVGGNRGAQGRTIVVDDAVLDELGQRFASTWQRPPTPQEITGLVDTWVRDEIAYREGVSLGLDRNDPLIRRRVRQKMDVLAEESRRSAAPTDAELEAWMKAHAERYAQPAVLAFEQVLVEPQGDATPEAALARVRSRLEAGEPPQSVSAARLLPTQVGETPIDLVARQFGTEFADAVAKLAPGAWQGPVRSGYGVHLVRVRSNTPGQTPSLDAARIAVARDFEKDRRDQATEAFYAQLRKKYDVRIEAAMARSVGPR